MFNDKYGLTQAVLDGRKTMTRRIINPQPQDCSSTHKEYIGASWKNEPMHLIVDGGDYAYCKLCGNGIAYPGDKELYRTSYKIGEVVAIAQRYKDILDSLPEGFIRKSDGYVSTIISSSAGYNNKMFVGADLMPHHIEITGIKVERLQDISNEDCLKEGIVRQEVISDESPFLYAYDAFLNGDNKYFASRWFKNPKEAFAVLIDKVSGKSTWERNPYVWVYEFALWD